VGQEEQVDLARGSSWTGEMGAGGLDLCESTGTGPGEAVGLDQCGSTGTGPGEAGGLDPKFIEIKVS
jgi:hypothetical protein